GDWGQRHPDVDREGRLDADRRTREGLMTMRMIRTVRTTRRVVAAALVSLPAWLGPACARDLSFQGRVAAPRAIEWVSSRHAISATQPFDEAVPRDVLEAKVRRYLRLSVALDRIWHTPVTAAMLRSEAERIAAGTRFPERLAEVSGALGNDPLV